MGEGRYQGRVAGVIPAGKAIRDGSQPRSIGSVGCMITLMSRTNRTEEVRRLYRGDMRDVIGEMGWGMMGGGYAGRYWKDEVGMMGGGYAGRTTSPKSARPGCRFLVPPPPACKGWRQERQTINEPKKRMLILYLDR